MHNVKPDGRVEIFDAERVVSLWSAQGMTLCKAGRGVADVSEADRDAMGARRDFWSMSGEFIVTVQCPENGSSIERVSIPTSVTTLMSRTKQNPIWTIWKRAVSMIWNIDGNRIVSESWIRFVKKRPPQGRSWVDVRLTNTQVTSRPATLWSEVSSSMCNFFRNEAPWRY